MNENNEPDPKMAAELRMTAGQEWADEAAEDERLTELLRRRRMSLGDVAKELVNRGDRVTAEFGGHTFSGAVVTAADDYVVVDGSGQIAELRLDAARWSVLAEGKPVESQGSEVQTFMAVLHQHASAESTLKIALPGGDMVLGKVAVVATDHIEVADVDGRVIYLPLEMVLGLIRSTDFH